MDIVHPKIEQYLDRVGAEKDPLHRELRKLAARRPFQAGPNRRIPFPIVGPLVGRVLMQLARMSGARRVFEFGSGFGYSAYWFGRGVGPSGEVILTEGDPENLAHARRLLKRLPRAPKFRFELGDAIESFERTKGTFDIVFFDLNKTQYPAALRKALPRVKRGGLLIADNVLWSGGVVRKSEDPSTRALQEYTRLIFSTRGLVSSILPLRDGVAVSRKE